MFANHDVKTFRSREVSFSAWCLMRRKCEVLSECARSDILGRFRTLSHDTNSSLADEAVTARNCYQLYCVAEQQITESVKISIKHQRNILRLDSIIPQKLNSINLFGSLPQEPNSSSTCMNRSSYFNIRAYMNINIDLYKLSCLQAPRNSFFLGNGCLSLRTFHTFTNKYTASIWCQQQTRFRWNSLQDIQKSKRLNTWLFSSCAALFSHMLIPFCVGHPFVSLQERNYSIKRKNYKFPELKPDDLEESFVRGSGPGGQAVNKTANCVVLKHKPSGLVVKCHETRSLEENKKLARQKLEEKLDQLLHGDESYLSQESAEGSRFKQEKKRRAKKRLELKQAFKEREGLD